MLPGVALHRRWIIRFLSFVVLPLVAWLLGLAAWDVSVDRARQRTLAMASSDDPALQQHLRERLADTTPAALIRSFRHLPEQRAGKIMLAFTVQALANSAHDDVVPLLIEALEDDHEKLRLRAAMCLAFMGRDALPAVIETLRSAPNARVRTSAAWILSLTGNDEQRAIEALEAALNDESKDVRYTANYSLHQLRISNNALRDAADLLRDESGARDD